MRGQVSRKRDESDDEALEITNVTLISAASNASHGCHENLDDAVALALTDEPAGLTGSIIEKSLTTRRSTREPVRAAIGWLSSATTAAEAEELQDAAAPQSKPGSSGAREASYTDPLRDGLAGASNFVKVGLGSPQSVSLNVYDGGKGLISDGGKGLRSLLDSKEPNSKGSHRLQVMSAERIQRAWRLREAVFSFFGPSLFALQDGHKAPYGKVLALDGQGQGPVALITFFDFELIAAVRAMPPAAQLLFASATVPRDFIAVSETTSIPLLSTFMAKHWRLRRPEVLITVTGGAQDFILKPSQLNAFQAGLISAAKSTNAWIVTAGSGPHRPPAPVCST